MGTNEADWISFRLSLRPTTKIAHGLWSWEDFLSLLDQLNLPMWHNWMTIMQSALHPSQEARSTPPRVKAV